MKSRLFFFLFFLLGMLLSGNVKAQDVAGRSSEKAIIGGREYYMHHVKQGQTLYGLSKLYNVSVSEIERLNPEVKNGLKAGHVIGIPVRPAKSSPKDKPQPAAAESKPVVETSKPVEVKPEPVVEQPQRKKDTVVVEHLNVRMPYFDGKAYIVQPGEDLYDIAKKVGIDLSEFKAANPGLSNEPAAGMRIVIPNVTNENDYIVHFCERNERVSSLLSRWKVNEKAFRTNNISLGTHVFEGQVVLIPIQRVTDFYWIREEDHYWEEIAELINEEPAKEPVVEVPVIVEPVVEEPVVVEPVVEEPKPVIIEEPVVEEPVVVEPVMEEPKPVIIEEPVIEEPVVVEPVVEEPKPVIIEEPVIEEPVVVEPAVEEPKPVIIEEPVVVEEPVIIEEPVVIEEPIEPLEIPAPQPLGFDFEMGDIPECVASPANALKRYQVALMVPLYLYDIDNIEVSKESAAKSKKSRSMSFLQFYEGFMMAAETLEKQGMKLDLTVFDVTENVSSAERALSQIRNKDLDLIVGPFFGKSFAVVEEYAKNHGIVVVNPLSTRKSVIEDSPNVMKMKAGDMGMILTISNLVKNQYSDANVFIVSREKSADTTFLSQMEHHLNLAINEEVTVSGDEFLHFARNESERLEMGSRLVPTINVEGQVYSTRDFQKGNTHEVVLTNTVRRYSYNDIGKMKSHLSGVRDNVIIAYGDDNVFATQILNSLTQEADRFPITLVCAPDWQKHEKLLVDNLLKMNAIYISDFFVDYNSEAAKRFVLRFRQKYVEEPQQYAFEGYDVGCYVLNALMQYGSDDLINCLHCYQASMLHTGYRFYYRNYLNVEGNDGKENLLWSIYQYDKDNIKLVPIDPFKKAESYE
ncbi:MAG: LysM peptidoglycan-binding domain-containing protein [Bacteroidales bacterium]|nr:LysM peptidoglycan-binding domain-containing protein [Bacteroidales bacterium]